MLPDPCLVIRLFETLRFQHSIVSVLFHLGHPRLCQESRSISLECQSSLPRIQRLLADAVLEIAEPVKRIKVFFFELSRKQSEMIFFLLPLTALQGIFEELSGDEPVQPLLIRSILKLVNRIIENVRCILVRGGKKNLLMVSNIPGLVEPSADMRASQLRPQRHQKSVSHDRYREGCRYGCRDSRAWARTWIFVLTLQ